MFYVGRVGHVYYLKINHYVGATSSFFFFLNDGVGVQVENL